MEGIYLFNLHLLFVIISIIILVAWLLFVILKNFTELTANNLVNNKKTGIKFKINTLDRNNVIKDARLFVKELQIRGSLTVQNTRKNFSGLKEKRLFTSTRSTLNFKNNRTFKTILFDMFLKYQFTICVEPKTPLSHAIPLSLLTSVSGSKYYLVLYGISIFYVLSMLYIAQIFPDSFGSKYLNFLKRHSSVEAFEKYCGNPWGVLKAAINNPEFIKVAAKNGAGKLVTCTGAAVVSEHVFHKAKLGQIYEYKMDQYMNNGLHSSGQPFEFKPNGPSILDNITGRGGN
uniref:hypothetical protein n=1 Tax=Cocconeiopsis kantsiensis TaxID=3082010 RepID=UPI003001D417